MFQPETSKRQKKPCRGLEISMPKSQTRGSSTNHTASSLLTTWGAVLGNPGTILVKAMPEGKRDLGSELLWSPPQKDCFKMSWVKNWGAVVHKGFYFRTWCLQSCQFNLHAYMWKIIHKYIYIYTYMQTLHLSPLLLSFFTCRLFLCWRFSPHGCLWQRGVLDKSDDIVITTCFLFLSILANTWSRGEKTENQWSKCGTVTKLQPLT